MSAAERERGRRRRELRAFALFLVIVYLAGVVTGWFARAVL